MLKTIFRRCLPFHLREVKVEFRYLRLLLIPANSEVFAVRATQYKHEESGSGQQGISAFWSTTLELKTERETHAKLPQRGVGG